MSSWTKTPFKTIKEAHATVKGMGMAPSAIIDTGAVKTFQVKEGRKTYVVAQKSDGTGPVKEKVIDKKHVPLPVDPSLPTWNAEEDALRAGLWAKCPEHATLTDAIEHLRRQFTNPADVEVVKILMVRIDELEYEYAQDREGIWVRVLAPK